MLNDLHTEPSGQGIEEEATGARILLGLSVSVERSWIEGTTYLVVIPVTDSGGLQPVLQLGIPFHPIVIQLFSP